MHEGDSVLPGSHKQETGCSIAGREILKILLRSGTSLTCANSQLHTWKDVMRGPNQLVTYSTDHDGVLIFWSVDIVEIRVSAEDVAASQGGRA